MNEFEQLCSKGPLRRGMSLVRIRQARLRAIGWDFAENVRLRPIVERLLVAVTLPIWGALVTLLWLGIKVSDPRSPALLIQERTGIHGTRLKVFKLRTMVPNAEQLQKMLAQHNISTGPNFRMHNDPRITGIGRILRKSHLDELPQLINVLKGDMSLVGPRPSTVSAEAFQGWQWPRLLSNPGITGLFQVLRAQTNDFDEGVRLEIRELRTRSLINDLKIILRTLLVAFVERKGF